MLGNTQIVFAKQSITIKIKSKKCLHDDTINAGKYFTIKTWLVGIATRYKIFAKI